MKYELIVIWETGEKNTYTYDTYEAAKEGEYFMKMANGNQISWTGVNKVSNGKSQNNK